MADLTVTPANVVPQAGAQIEHGTYGATVTAGQAVYLNTTTGKWELADADVAASANAVGIALNNGAINQKGSIIVGGSVAMGAILTVGTVYVVSATAGGICPDADLASGDYVTILGTPLSTSILKVQRLVTGVAKA